MQRSNLRGCRAKQHSQGLFPAFFMTGIQFIYFYVEIDKLDTRLQPGFTEITFFIFQLLDSCVHENDSKKSCIANLIQECFKLTHFCGQIRSIFFYKIERDFSIKSLLYKTFLKLYIYTFFFSISNWTNQPSCLKFWTFQPSKLLNIFCTLATTFNM